jgi:hypothetical protein
VIVLRRPPRDEEPHQATDEGAEERDGDGVGSGAKEKRPPSRVPVDEEVHQMFIEGPGDRQHASSKHPEAIVEMSVP